MEKEILEERLVNSILLNRPRLQTLLKKVKNAGLAHFLKYRGVKLEGPVTWAGNKLPNLEIKGIANLGRYVCFRCVNRRSSLHVYPEGTLEVGDLVSFNQGLTLVSAKCVSIGRDSRIGEEVTIYDTDFHPVAPNQPVRVAPVKLGRNVWLGHRVTVLPGVEIGDHSVVAAGAVVTASIPPRSVAAGVPARVIKAFECADDWRRT